MSELDDKLESGKSLDLDEMVDYINQLRGERDELKEKLNRQQEEIEQWIEATGVMYPQEFKVVREKLDGLTTKHRELIQSMHCLDQRISRMERKTQ